MTPLIPFWFLPPMMPGIFEPLLFFILLKVFAPKTPPLRIFAIILLAIGALWTFFAAFTLRAFPYLLFAAYAIPAVFAALFTRKAKTRRGLLLVTLATDLILVAGVLLLMYVPFPRDVTVLCTSCSEQPLHAVNGYQLRLQLNGDPREFTFSNQGFAQAKEQANVNHQQILDHLAATAGKTLPAVMEVVHYYGVPWEPRLVAVDGKRFDNFHYLPDLLHDGAALLDLPKKEAAP